MSGGIVQLVATGAQDAWLTGKPEVSFFRANYRRYTHYASSVERQVIQGAPIAGGISTIRFEKKGDLLNYVYLTARDGNGATVPIVDWSKVIDKIEFMIGGQVIDTQDVVYSTKIEPVTGAQNYSQRLLIGNVTDPTNATNVFYPVKFFFNKDWSVSLPLVALQFHDVELRITWSANLESATGFTAPGANNGPQAAKYNNLQYICWGNFTYLDQAERDYFANTPQDLLITQVQRTIVLGSQTMQELALAQPVKFLAFTSNNYTQAYGSTGSNSALVKDHMLKTQVNGVDVGEFRHLPTYVDLPQYFNTPFGYLPNGQDAGLANVGIISYCLDTSKLQPTGTLNFSRLDTYRIVVPPTITIGALIKSTYLYAVGYNVLRIQNGLGSVLYAN
jgi:hypothetical protein